MPRIARTDDVLFYALGAPTISPKHQMRIVMNIVAALFVLVGCVWFLQGVNVLPGSFMTGQTKWAIYGAILFVVGVGLFVASNRRRV
jgi:hypothetical protein